MNLQQRERMRERFQQLTPINALACAKQNKSGPAKKPN